MSPNPALRVPPKKARKLTTDNLEKTYAQAPEPGASVKRSPLAPAKSAPWSLFS